MKISINCSLNDSAYGGGANFVKNISDYLISNNHEVHYDLKCKDLDIILIIDPRNIKSFTNYSLSEIIRYLKFKNPKAIVVHRINECDERKNTNFMNKKLRTCNYLADHTVVISNYLKKLDIFYNKKFISTILNGSDQKIFKSSRKPRPSIYKIITHHWSPNFLKGHDIYLYLDKLCGLKKWKKKISFTYIGNLPIDINYNNTKIIKPMYGVKLSRQLQKHDIYVTASNNDPGPSHHIEGALCGLPLLFKNSGGIPETAKGYGLMFEGKHDFEKTLEKLIVNYKKYKNKINTYPYTKERMCKDYLKLFEHILKSRKKYYRVRVQKKNYLEEFKNFLNLKII